MHDIVSNQLEDLLSGGLSGQARESVEAHLSACFDCRTAVQEMRRHGRLLSSLRTPGLMDPAPGFYARVMQRVEEQYRPGFWNLLLDPVFGRRLVYATLSLTLLLGAFLLVTQSDEQQIAQTPVEVLAVSERQAPAPAVQQWGSDVQQERQTFLVTLASASD